MSERIGEAVLAGQALIVLAAVAAAWRLGVVRLRAGRASLRRVHPAWFITAVLGALPAPAAALVSPVGQLTWER